jgi:VCBS repeat protein/ASPIC/UnbV protein
MDVEIQPLLPPAATASPVARRGRLLRRALLCLGLLGLGLPLAAGLWLGQAYRGFTAHVLADLRYSSWADFKAQYRYLAYYLDFYERLRRNPVTGDYDFKLAGAAAAGDARLSGFERGRMAFHLGDFGRAARLIAADIRDRGESEDKLFWLAVSYQRWGEAENCAAGSAGGVPPANRCVLPVSTLYRRTAATASAAAAFRRLLDRYDPDNPLYRWLLDFTSMTLGRYPAGVPAQYRLRGPLQEVFYGDVARARRAEYANLMFAERAAELGAATNDAGKGVAVEDFDGDGYLDVVTGGTFSAVVFLHNEQGHGFVDRTREVGLAGVRQPFIITAADYDNDGRMDLFVGRPFQRFMLLRNQPDGTFADVTLAAGLLPGEPKPDEAVFTTISAWDDVDGDGYLDLFVGSFGLRIPGTTGLLAKKPMSSRLFLNREVHPGVRGFVDATKEVGLSGVVADQVILGAAFGDYDGDGWDDLFLSSFTRGHSVLLHNAGGRRFEATDLVRSPRSGFMASFVDVDHDGRLDLFWTSAGTAMAAARNVLADRGASTHTLLLQRGGRFEDRPDLFRDRLAIGTMGASFGDLDNDGCADFYLGTGDPESWFIMPNLMYVGELAGTRCTGAAQNVSMLGGWGTVQKGHGIVFADFDQDGRQDVYSSLGGMWPADNWPHQLFINQSRLANSWLKIRLRGRRTNRSGVGATIRVRAATARGEAVVRYYRMDNKTGFGSAPYLAHLGLARAVRVDAVDVYWPGSRVVKRYPAALGRLNVLDEAQGEEIGPRLEPPE